MSDTTPLSGAEVEALRKKHPELPSEYFDYLLNVGWGQTDSGRMIYQAPVSPVSIFGDRYRDSAIILLGDDMQGYCFGFDRVSRRVGEISDFGEWELWPERKTFTDYIRDDG